MGYAKEKAAVEKRVKTYKIILTFAIVAIVIGLCVFGFFVPPSSWKYYFSLPKIEKRNFGELRLHFLSVGQGDCTLIELPDGKTVLIDGGPDSEEASGTVLRYLNALDIEKIDALILTHGDSDHCGGLIKIVEYKEIGRAFLPYANLKESETYANLLAKLNEEEVAWEYISRVSKLFENNGEYSMHCLYPYSLKPSEEDLENWENNKYSSVISLEYQNVRMLFTGDMPTKTEQILMRDYLLGLYEKQGFLLNDIDILKVAHHGSKYTTSEDFLEFIGVETAVISCGKDNEYGHPHEEVLKRLQAVNAECYRTDLHGSLMITVTQNGEYGVFPSVER
jgi:competence protein ComEC